MLKEDFRLQPNDTRVAAGETAMMECGPPKGQPEPTVYWTRNGQKLDTEISKKLVFYGRVEFNACGDFLMFEGIFSSSICCFVLGSMTLSDSPSQEVSLYVRIFQTSRTPCSQKVFS